MMVELLAAGLTGSQLSFEAADVDGDGLVDKAELHAMMEKMGRSFTLHRATN